MAPKWILFIVFIWVTGSIMGALMENGSVGTYEKETTDKLTAMEELFLDQEWGVTSIITAPPKFFSAITDILAFKFSYLEDNYYATLFRYMVLIPITALIVYGLFMSMLGVFSRVIP